MIEKVYRFVKFVDIHDLSTDGVRFWQKECYGRVAGRVKAGRAAGVVGRKE